MSKCQTLTDKAKVNLTRKILRLVAQNKKLIEERDDARSEVKRVWDQKAILEKATRDQAERQHYFGKKPADWHAGVWVIQCAQKAINDLEWLKKKQEKEARKRRKAPCKTSAKAS